MTKLEILKYVRRFISDEQATGYTDTANLEQPDGKDELINYLDRAVETYSVRQAAARDMRLVKSLSITNGMAIPKDFLGFAGLVPISTADNAFRFYGHTSTLAIKYFARLPYVSGFNDNDSLPYQHDQEMTIAALAAIYALNKHEFNVSQDLMLLGYGGGAAANGDTDGQAS